MKTSMLNKLLSGLLLASGIAVAGGAAAADAPRRPECIAPAQPGGGFDLTCRLAQEGMDVTKQLTEPMRIIYMPGGIGAVAYNHVVGQKPDAANTIIAFSGGSLLNLAQGKFGKYGVNDVRWVAAVGADYGVAMVRNDSPYKTLGDLMAALKADPSKIVLGAGGTVGSQDWMKAALTARAAGVDFRKMRFVAFEGGGESATALRGGHIQAYMGDAAEAYTLLQGGAPVRVLAVFAQERLPGDMANVPTAREQGFDIDWPIIRGFYVGPKVSDAAYNFWVQAFRNMEQDPKFGDLQKKLGLFPFRKSGDDLDKFVKERVAAYGAQAQEFGLMKK